MARGIRIESEDSPLARWNAPGQGTVFRVIGDDPNFSKARSPLTLGPQARSDHSRELYCGIRRTQNIEHPLHRAAITRIRRRGKRTLESLRPLDIHCRHQELPLGVFCRDGKASRPPAPQGQIKIESNLRRDPGGLAHPLEEKRLADAADFRVRREVLLTHTQQQRLQLHPAETRPPNFQ